MHVCVGPKPLFAKGGLGDSPSLTKRDYMSGAPALGFATWGSKR